MSDLQKIKKTVSFSKDLPTYVDRSVICVLCKKGIGRFTCNECHKRVCMACGDRCGYCRKIFRCSDCICRRMCKCYG